MKTLIVINEKGGVGKTTVVMNISAEMAREGLNVLIVDADPQADTSTGFGLKEAPRLHDLIVRENSWADSIQPVPKEFYMREGDTGFGVLHCVTGDKETRMIALLESDAMVFSERLQELGEQNIYDVVVIDTSPSPSLFHSMLLLASTHAVFPTETEAFSALKALNKIVERCKKMYAQGKRADLEVAKPVAIIPMKYRKKTILHQRVLEKIKAKFGNLVLPPMALNVSVGESQIVRGTLYTLDAKFNSTKYMQATAKTIMSRMGLEVKHGA